LRGHDVTDEVTLKDVGAAVHTVVLLRRASKARKGFLCFRHAVRCMLVAQSRSRFAREHEKAWVSSLK
jgi:microcompartment protein CcmK/EutM